MLCQGVDLKTREERKAAVTAAKGLVGTLLYHIFGRQRDPENPASTQSDEDFLKTAVRVEYR